MSKTTDGIYYAHGMKVPLASRVAQHARRNMFDHFLTVMKPDVNSKILDFGVSEEVTEEANFLEKEYPHQGQITCAGIGDGYYIKKAYPLVQYVKIDAGSPLPFKDKQFNVAYSNAVFEHLGSDEERKRTFFELSRVAERVYITVPNRWFPVEHHTGIPLLHFSPLVYRFLIRRSALSYWSDPKNMEFLSKRHLEHMLGKDTLLKSSYAGIVLGPFSSNIAIWT